MLMKNKLEYRHTLALKRLSSQALLAKDYASKHNFNDEIVFLIDMSVHSGKNRFFVYNIKKGGVEHAALVAHGVGSTVPGSVVELRFSNKPMSLQTSLGTYKIGSSYYGKFGLAFKLYGLDKTNDKVYARSVVLHAHSQMPETETYPVRIPESFGCPMVSTAFLETLNGYITGSSKPILMWIYN